MELLQIPQSLKRDSGYDHRNALFGQLPYGGSIQQQVYYTEDKMCKGGTDLQGDIFPSAPESPFILMMDRGDCTFVTKVRNAQHFGAAAVLIADDKCQCNRSNCTKAFDGQACETLEPVRFFTVAGVVGGITSCGSILSFDVSFVFVQNRDLT